MTCPQQRDMTLYGYWLPLAIFVDLEMRYHSWSVWSWIGIAAKKTAGDESIGIRFVWDEPVWSGLIIYSIG